MPALVGVVDGLGGIATRRQLLAAGATGAQLTRAVRDGSLSRVRRAYYSSSSARPSALVAVRVGGRLAGVSAAESYGLWAGFDRRVHIAVPRNAARLRPVPAVVAHAGPAPEVVIHWVEAKPARECWRVPPIDCLRQVVEWADRETAVACLESAVSMLAISRDELIMRMGPTSVRGALRASSVRGGLGSGAESIVAQRLARRGVALIPQWSAHGVGYVDFLVAGTRVILEIDGYAFHADRDAFERDRRRDAELAARGRVVIRLTLSRILGDWDGCERQILAAIRIFS